MEDNYCNIDQLLLRAYLETIYTVEKLDIQIQIGQKNEELENLLVQYNAPSWAFITAWNPKSVSLSKDENLQRHQRLVEMVEKAAYSYFVGKGVGKGTTWEPELSLLILNIPTSEALKLGKYFDQKAIVYGEKGGLPQLLFC